MNRHEAAADDIGIPFICKQISGAIINPLRIKMMASIVGAEALNGRNSYCINYLKAYRADKVN
jgi:hypothetical protein